MRQFLNLACTAQYNAAATLDGFAAGTCKKGRGDREITPLVWHQFANLVTCGTRRTTELNVL